MAAVVSGYMASATQPRKRATRARFGPIGGRTSGSRPAPLDSRGSIASILRSVGGSSRSRPDPLGQAENAQLLEPVRRHERRLDPTGVREQVMEDQPLKQAGAGAGRSVLLHGDLERLDQLAVLDARRAGRSRRPGSRGRDQGDGGRPGPSRAGRRSRRASGRSARAGCRSRRWSRRTSGNSRCRARSERIPGNGGTRSARPATPGQSRGSARGSRSVVLASVIGQCLAMQIRCQRSSRTDPDSSGRAGRAPA